MPSGRDARRAPSQDAAAGEDDPFLPVGERPPGAPEEEPATGKPARRAWAYERGRLWVWELEATGRDGARGSTGEQRVPGAHSRAPLQELEVPAVLGEVTDESAQALARAMGAGELETALRRFEGGRRCFAAWVEDQIAAYCWVSQARECVGEMEREIRIQAGEAYIWDCATLPRHRRKGLYTTLLGFILKALGREGCRRVWIGSAVNNLASARAFEKAGFRPVVTMIYARLLNLSVLLPAGHPAAPKNLVDLAVRRMTAPHERVLGPLRVSLSGPTDLPACES